MFYFQRIAMSSDHKSLFIKDLLDSLPTLTTPDVHVSVVGIAVDVISPDPEVHPTRPMVVTLDDGTGVIRCVLFRHHELEHLKMVKIGDCFLARGVISEYFEQTQIKCAALKIIKDPDFEKLYGSTRFCWRRRIENQVNAS